MYQVENVEIKGKTEKYHTWEQFKRSIEKSWKETKSVPLIHKYMTAHFSGLVQALQSKKVAELN